MDDVPGPSHRPTEPIRALLKQKIKDDPERTALEVARLVGLKQPSLTEFLNTPGAGSKAFPKLCKLYGIDPFENQALDEDQRELLRILDEARDRGRDSTAIVAAFRTLVDPPAPRPSPPKSRGSQSS
jgi:hypothetical protein